MTGVMRDDRAAVAGGRDPGPGRPDLRSPGGDAPHACGAAAVRTGPLGRAGGGAAAPGGADSGRPARQGGPRPGGAEQGSRDALHGRWADNIGQTRQIQELLAPRQPLEPAVIDETERLALRFLAGRAPLFDARIRDGRIVDGHGDLLADDIFCLDDGPRILDCLDFDDRLRIPAAPPHTLSRRCAPPWRSRSGRARLARSRRPCARRGRPPRRRAACRYGGPATTARQLRRYTRAWRYQGCFPP